MKFTALLAVSLISAASALPQGIFTGPGPVLTFDNFVQKAIDRVHSKYPQAKLLFAIGTPIAGVAVADNMATVQHIKAGFSTGSGSAIIESNDKTLDFGKIQYHNQPLIGTRIIEWPSDVKVSGLDADQVLKSNGVTEGYTQVELRFPLYPGIEQPFYFFTLKSGKQVSVGAGDGTFQKDE